MRAARVIASGSSLSAVSRAVWIVFRMGGASAPRRAAVKSPLRNNQTRWASPAGSMASETAGTPARRKLRSSLDGMRGAPTHATA